MATRHREFRPSRLCLFPVCVDYFQKRVEFPKLAPDHRGTWHTSMILSTRPAVNDARYRPDSIAIVASRPSPMQLSASCEDRKALLARYSEATRAYAESVRQLTDRTGTTAREDYLQLRVFAEDARVRSEAARIAYENHVREHRCHDPGLLA